MRALASPLRWSPVEVESILSWSLFRVVSQIRLWNELHRPSLSFAQSPTCPPTGGDQARTDEMPALHMTAIRKNTPVP